MPKPVKMSDLPIEHPADAAWEECKVFHGPYPAMDKDTARLIFAAGWNAALAWLPVGIQQFRELEEGLRKEIEELQSQLLTNRNTSSS